AGAKAAAKGKPAVLKQTRGKSPVPSPEEVDALLKKTRMRGFVTESEVLMVFKDLEEYVPLFEEFLAKLDHIGVQIIEMKEGILGRQEEREATLNSVRAT